MVATVAQTPAETRGQRAASSVVVGLALARRSLVNIFRVPGAFVPILVMPIFFLLSFSGSFSGLARGGILPTRNMLNWVMPYAILNGSAFAGQGATFSVARDLEGSFYDRLLLSPSPRRALLFGPIFASVIRSLFPVAIVFVVASIGGARLTSVPLGLFTLVIAATGVATMSCLWGLGIAYRFKTQRSLGLVQVIIFAAMFLSAAQVPVRNIEGWVQPIAQINPVTNILRLAREGFLPGGVTWGDTWGGLVAIAVAIGLLSWWAIRGLRRLIP